MQKLSAGIVAYRKNNDKLEVLLVHPGGPFFAKKDIGVWSIPKGEYVDGEDALLAAKREFAEETGNTLPEGEFLPLKQIKIKSGKVISAWAVEADFVQPFVESNFFEMEWPPRSGKKQLFPETDRAEWFTAGEAKKKITSGQISLLEQLEIIIKPNP